MRFGLLPSDLEAAVEEKTDREWEEDLEETRRLREASNLRQINVEREMVRLKEENARYKVLIDKLGEEVSGKDETIATLEREKQENEKKFDAQILSKSEEVKELSAELQNSSKRNSELNEYVLKLQNEKKPPQPQIKIEAVQKQADTFLGNLFGDLNRNHNFGADEDYYEEDDDDWEEDDDDWKCYNCTGKGHFARECPSDCRKCEDRHCHASRDCFFHDSRKMPRYHGYYY